MPSKRKYMILCLAPETHAGLRKLAVDRGYSMSGIVRVLLEKWAKEEGLDLPIRAPLGRPTSAEEE